MKSAYRFKIPEPDRELTHISPGTPCGELMRRYWQPFVCSPISKTCPTRFEFWAKIWSRYVRAVYTEVRKTDLGTSRDLLSSCGRIINWRQYPLHAGRHTGSSYRS